MPEEVLGPVLCALVFIKHSPFLCYLSLEMVRAMGRLEDPLNLFLVPC